MPFVSSVIQQHLKPYKKSLLFVLFLMLLGIFFEALSPWAFKLLIDNVLENEQADGYSLTGLLMTIFSSKISLGFFAAFLFFITRLLGTITSYIRSLITKQVLQDVMYNFSKQAFSNIEMLSIGFYRNQEIGDYIYRLNFDVSALGELIEEGILPLISSTLYVVGIGTILFIISPKLALLSLITLPVLLLGLYIINKKVISQSKRSEYWNSAILSFIQQTLTQLKIIQAYSQEKHELHQFKKRVHSSLSLTHSVAQVNFALTLFVSIVVALIYSVIIGSGIISVFEGELSAGLLIVFLFYLNNVTNPVLSIMYAVGVIRESKVKLARIEEFFNQKTHIKDTGKVTEISDTTIDYKHVTLKAADGATIVEDVSATLPKGKITAILGVSGSGKTSLVTMLPRLLKEPTAGQIRIGDTNIEDYSLKTLRSNIAFVPQEAVLFNTTIRDIIGFGKDGATDDEIWDSAKLAVADEFIKNRPGKLDFKVGEAGTLLSLGERQRLMLARAYIKNAPIMILDEVFSAQDSKTRLQMLEKFKQYAKGKTILLVSNILEVVSEADEFIILHKGKLQHTFTHKEFLKKGYFKEAAFTKLLQGK
jgi:ABC-type multidrug transport system fused ATPase/permease subunit